MSALTSGQAAAGVSAALSTCKTLLAGATARAARPAPTGDADLVAWKAKTGNQNLTQGEADTLAGEKHSQEVDLANVQIITYQGQLSALLAQASGGAICEMLGPEDFKMADFLENGSTRLWGELIEAFGDYAKASERAEGSHFSRQVHALVEAAATFTNTSVAEVLADKAAAGEAIAAVWKARRLPHFLAFVPRDPAHTRRARWQTGSPARASAWPSRPATSRARRRGSDAQVRLCAVPLPPPPMRRFA